LCVGRYISTANILDILQFSAVPSIILYPYPSSPGRKSAFLKKMGCVRFIVGWQALDRTAPQVHQGGTGTFPSGKKMGCPVNGLAVEVEHPKFTREETYVSRFVMSNRSWRRR
jgi:hypothetical protein